jgi:predicted nucleic acid-binding protein
MSNIVISNATPIISLSSVGCEFVLNELFHHILIPRAVDMELRSLDKPGSRFSDLKWVEVVSVQNEEVIISLRKDIDKGEAETIALAKQMNADVVIIDENAGYQIAKHFGLPVVRTLSMLKVAKDKKIISKIRPIVEQMVKRGRWYSKNVIDKFLGDVGE